MVPGDLNFPRGLPSEPSVQSSSVIVTSVIVTRLTLNERSCMFKVVQSLF
jgi:hypothetical protein